MREIIIRFSTKMPIYCLATYFMGIVLVIFALFVRSESSLQLIDFGKAVDLSLEPPEPSEGGGGAGEGRRGKYHLDYFGIAGCAHCLLFGQYIEVTTNRYN